MKVPQFGVKGKWVEFPRGPATVIGKPASSALVIRKNAGDIVTLILLAGLHEQLGKAHRAEWRRRNAGIKDLL